MILRLINLLRRKTNQLKYWKDKGLKIGQGCRLVGNVSFGSEPYLIEIGNHVSITNSKFVTHDGGIWVFRQENPKIDLFRKIRIGDNVFIGVDCIILPGTIIGDNVIIGAGSIVRGKLESNSVYAGVPVKKIKNLEDYYNDIKDELVETKHLNGGVKKNYLIELFK